jgi:antitoxin component YwqK of YwqJK toxin-antitoxin module
MIGEGKGYYQNGNLNWLVTYKDGKLFTDKSFTESGQVLAELTYKDEKKSGIERRYFDGGNLSWENWFKDGKRTLSKQYYQGGNLAKEIHFSNGKAVKGYQYTYEGEKSDLTNAHFHNLGFDY